MYEDMKFVGGEEVINESINEVSKHSHKLLAKKKCNSCCAKRNSSHLFAVCCIQSVWSQKTKNNRTKSEFSLAFMTIR